MEDAKSTTHALRVKSEGRLRNDKKKVEVCVSSERLHAGSREEYSLWKRDCNWELGNLVRKFQKLIKNLLEGKMC